MGALGANKTAAKPTPAPTKAAAPAPAKTQAPASRGAPARAGAPAGFDDAQARGARNYLTPIDDYTAAVYTLKINRLQLIQASESKAAKKCESSVIEFEVVESNNPKCPVGFVGAVVYTDRHFQEIYWGNVKGFLAAFLGVEPEDIKTKQWHVAFGRFDLVEFDSPDEERETEKEVDALLGGLVKCTVRYKLRDGKKPITQELWTPYEAAE